MVSPNYIALGRDPGDDLERVDVGTLRAGTIFRHRPGPLRDDAPGGHAVVAAATGLPHLHPGQRVLERGVVLVHHPAFDVDGDDPLVVHAVQQLHDVV